MFDLRMTERQPDASVCDVDSIASESHTLLSPACSGTGIPSGTRQILNKAIEIRFEELIAAAIKAVSDDVSGIFKTQQATMQKVFECIVSLRNDFTRRLEQVETENATQRQQILDLGVGEATTIIRLDELSRSQSASSRHISQGIFAASDESTPRCVLSSTKGDSASSTEPNDLTTATPGFTNTSCGSSSPKTENIPKKPGVGLRPQSLDRISSNFTEQKHCNLPETRKMPFGELPLSPNETSPSTFKTGIEGASVSGVSPRTMSSSKRWLTPMLSSNASTATVDSCPVVSVKQEISSECAQRFRRETTGSAPSSMVSSTREVSGNAENSVFSALESAPIRTVSLRATQNDEVGMQEHVVGRNAFGPNHLRSTRWRAGSLQYY